MLDFLIDDRLARLETRAMDFKYVLRIRLILLKFIDNVVHLKKYIVYDGCTIIL